MKMLVFMMMRRRLRRLGTNAPLAISFFSFPSGSGRPQG